MSGGSLNYLCYKDTPDLFNAVRELEQVEQHLLQRSAPDVAKDVRRLIEYIQTAENRISVLSENLNGIFKAIEWQLSGDWGEKSLQEAIDQYRGEAKA